MGKVQTLMKYALLISAFSFIALAGCGQQAKTRSTAQLSPSETEITVKVSKSEAEWKQILTPEQYYVLRQQGTEAAFTGKYFDHKEKGIYTCAACGNELFSSTSKFRSGTGWPSFYQPVAETNVGTEEDRTLGMVRSEVHCARCGGHLGHIFNDGPRPTGLRYCINSVSLNFEPKK